MYACSRNIKINVGIKYTCTFRFLIKHSSPKQHSALFKLFLNGSCIPPYADID